LAAVGRKLTDHSRHENEVKDGRRGGPNFQVKLAVACPARIIEIYAMKNQSLVKAIKVERYIIEAGPGAQRWIGETAAEY